MPSMEEKIRALRAKSDALGQKSDSLNKAIQKLEADLAGIGVAVWLDNDHFYVIDPSEPDEHGYISGWVIGYAKLGANWRLAARQFEGGRYTEGEFGQSEWYVPSGGQMVALADAPRLVRVQAAGLFEHLVDALDRRVEEYISSVDRATTRTS